MKAYHSLIIFFLIVASAVVSSIRSYDNTRAAIVHDMNQALERTLQLKQEAWITPDTIRVYRSNLRIAWLREHSFVTYAVPDSAAALCSERMRWQGGRQSLVFQSYATCSFATVFSMSNQQLPMSLSALSLLWIVLSMGYIKRHRKGLAAFGGLCFHAADRRFYDSHHRRVAFTPMQEQLLAMFFEAADHRLEKQAICDALWPKKPDATDTLYTLIRRLKPVVEEHSRLRIVADRGRAYELVEAGPTDRS